MEGHKVRMETRRFDRNKFLLESRGFNRIQERPLTVDARYDRHDCSPNGLWGAIGIDLTGPWICSRRIRDELRRGRQPCKLTP
jgi:hypothetical protein